MDTATIIQMIIAILTIVLQYIGGGTFENKTLSDKDATQLQSTNFQCGKAYWVEAPEIIQGRFEGRVGLDCEAEGLSGGGLDSLGRHLRALTVQNSSRIFSETQDEAFEGLPSQKLRHLITLAVGSDKFDVSGVTNVATDGVSMLRSVFQSVEIPTEGAIGYLKDFQDEIEVIPSESDGRFYVRLLSSSRVSRPTLISEGDFKSAMIRQHEERIESRSSLILRDITSHL